MSPNYLIGGMVIAFAAIAILAFLVGGLVTKIRFLDFHGRGLEARGLRKGLYAMLAVSALLFIGIAALVYGGLLNTEPVLLSVSSPADWYLGVGMLLSAISLVAGILGTTAMKDVLQKSEKEPVPQTTKKPSIIKSLALPFCMVLAMVMAFGTRVAAAEANNTVDLSALGSLFQQLGGIMPDIVVLIVAAVPVIIIMIGLKFCGGFLKEFLEMFKEFTHF